MTYTHLILLILGTAGFLLASYIYFQKRQQKPLVCPLRSKCDLVTHGTYSKVFGIPVELVGMCYYAFIVVFHGFILADSDIFNLATVRFSLVVVGIAFLFSLYLVSLQAFVLKEWCTWCLCSALLCVAIFLITFIGLPAGIL